MFRKQFKSTFKPKMKTVIAKDDEGNELGRHVEPVLSANKKPVFVETFAEVEEAREKLEAPVKPEEPEDKNDEDARFVYQCDLAAYYLDVAEYERRSEAEDRSFRAAEDKRQRKAVKRANIARYGRYCP